jgi:hypothetical protein
MTAISAIPWSKVASLRTTALQPAVRAAHERPSDDAHWATREIVRAVRLCSSMTMVVIGQPSEQRARPNRGEYSARVSFGSGKLLREEAASRGPSARLLNPFEHASKLLLGHRDLLKRTRAE